MYLRDSFYMAGWSTDFTSDTIAQVSLLGEPLVFYRTEAGSMAALEDRCVHRFAPLSKGRREGNDLRCMYHGIKFGPDGQCTDLPGQPVIPKTVCVRSFPVVEKQGVVWVWMGDPASMDESFIPDFFDNDLPDWAIKTGMIEIEAEAQLLVDNLLDVSHAPYVHEVTFAAGNQANVARMVRAEHESLTERLPRGVRVTRWIVGREHNHFLGGITTDDFSRNEVVVPGVFTMSTRCYAEGTNATSPELAPPATAPLMARFVGQIITPVADGKCRLYYAAALRVPHDTWIDSYFETVTTAFHEDEDIIVGQQQIINSDPERRMMPLNMDGPLTRFEGIVRKLGRAEQERAAAA